MFFFGGKVSEVVSHLRSKKHEARCARVRTRHSTLLLRHFWYCGYCCDVLQCVYSLLGFFVFGSVNMFIFEMYNLSFNWQQVCFSNNLFTQMLISRTKSTIPILVLSLLSLTLLFAFLFFLWVKQRKIKICGMFWNTMSSLLMFAVAFLFQVKKQAKKTRARGFYFGGKTGTKNGVSQTHWIIAEKSTNRLLST